MITDRGRCSTLNRCIMGVAAVVALTVVQTRANDWPCFRGPNSDGHTDEKVTITNWPPQEVWRANVGHGFSQVVVSQGKVYAMGWVGTPPPINGQPVLGLNTIWCFSETSTGTNPTPVWTNSYSCLNGQNQTFYAGTYPTPAVSSGQVYTIDNFGNFKCYSATNGTLLWTNSAFSGNGPDWAGSPFVEGDLVLVNSGGPNGVSAFSKTSHSIVLGITSGGSEARYSSPFVTTIGGQRTIIGFGGNTVGGNVVGIDPSTGNVLWSLGASISTAGGGPIADPLIINSNMVLVSVGYSQGCEMAHLGGSGQLTPAWRNGVLNTKENTAVYYGGYVYGIDENSGLKCIDPTTGNQMWASSSSGVNFGTESVVLGAGDQLIIMTGNAAGMAPGFSGNGDLVVAQASTNQYTELHRLPKIMNDDTWIAPTLCNGLLYVRSLDGTLICYKVGEPPPSASTSGYRMPIQFTGYTPAQGGTLTNFPALVTLSNNINNSAFDFGQMVSPSDGADLRFYSADTVTELNYEIDTWNTNGASYVWVQVPALASSNDYIWAYWGDPNNASSPAYTKNGGAWDSTFVGVWHMNEAVTNGGIQADSTSNHNDMVWVSGGASTSGVPAVIGGGDYIHGTGCGMKATNTPSLTTLKHITWSLWANGHDLGDGNYWHLGAMMNKSGNLILTQHSNPGIELMLVSSQDGTGRRGTGYAIPVITNHWNYIAGVWDSITRNAYVYCNGYVGGHATGADVPYNSNEGGDLLWGLEQTGMVPTCYTADEARFENVPRESNWVWSCFMTMASNSIFQTYGPAGGVSPVTGIVQFASSAYSVPENGGSVTVKVYRLNGPSGAVTVDFATSGGTAVAGVNYVYTNGTLAFANGETSKTFTVAVMDDGVWEPGNLTLNLVLSHTTGNAIYGTPASAVLTIIDVDGPGSFQFSSSGYAVSQDAGTMSITVTRANGKTGAASVSYYTSDGTAQNGVNYTTTSGTLNFGNNETSKTFNVTILNAAVSDSGKTVNLTLSNPTAGATVGTPGTAILTIVPPGPFSVWPHKMNIQFPGYANAAGQTLTNFPVELVFSNNMGGGFSYSQALPVGGDLRFSDSTNAVALNFEIEKWDTNGPSYVWVQVPVLSNNCSVWAFWGKSDATPAACATNGATWSSDFRGVWHLGEVNGATSHFDSTANGNNATTNGTTGMGTTGVVDGAAAYTGVDIGRITNMNNSLTITGNVLTVGIWVQPTATLNQTAKVGFLGKLQESGGAGADYGLFYDWTSVHFAGGGMSVGAYDPPINAWTYLVGVCDGSYARFYVNGVQYSSTVCSGNTPNNYSVLIGGGYWGGKLNGKLDEGRIMAAAASSNWIWTSYMNMVSNSAFCCFTNNTSTSGTAAMGTPISWLEEYGFTSNFNAAELSDPDGDGVPVWQDYIMGADPTSSSSALKATIQRTAVGNGVAVSFPSIGASGTDYLNVTRYYTLEGTTNLIMPNWQPIANYSNLPATGAQVIYTNASPSLKNYYRTRVWLQ